MSLNHHLKYYELSCLIEYISATLLHLPIVKYRLSQLKQHSRV